MLRPADLIRTISAIRLSKCHSTLQSTHAHKTEYFYLRLWKKLEVIPFISDFFASNFRSRKISTQKKTNWLLKKLYQKIQSTKMPYSTCSSCFPQNTGINLQACCDFMDALHTCTISILLKMHCNYF